MSESRFQRRVLFLLTDIRDLVKQVGHTYSATDAPCRLEQMAELDEVQDLETELNNSDEKRQLLGAQLSKIGGVSLRDCTQKIMHKLMTNRLMAAMNVNRHGGKFAFGSTTLAAVVTESVLRNFSGTQHELEVAVTSVLKYAPDQKGGGGRKN